MFAFLYGLQSISPAALHRAQQLGTVAIFDLNARMHWERGHVPGALHLPVEFTRADLPPDPATRLVFYCSNPLCRKAPTAGRRATQMGYADVMVMSAGIAGWRAAGLPTESHPPA
jgi:rhodanese-related sulfurtransferase